MKQDPTSNGGTPPPASPLDHALSAIDAAFWHPMARHLLRLVCLWNHSGNPKKTGATLERVGDEIGALLSAMQATGPLSGRSPEEINRLIMPAQVELTRAADRQTWTN